MPFRRVLVTRNNPYQLRPFAMEPMAEREYVYLFEEIRVIYPIDSTEYDLSKFIDVAEIGWMDGWKVYSLI